MPGTAAMAGAIFGSTLATSGSGAHFTRADAKHVAIILGGIFGGLVVLLILCCIMRCCLEERSKNARRQRESDSEERMRGGRRHVDLIAWREAQRRGMEIVRESGEEEELGVRREREREREKFEDEMNGRFRRWVWKVSGR